MIVYVCGKFFLQKCVRAQTKDPTQKLVYKDKKFHHVQGLVHTHKSRRAQKWSRLSRNTSWRIILSLSCPIKNLTRMANYQLHDGEIFRCTYYIGDVRNMMDRIHGIIFTTNVIFDTPKEQFSFLSSSDLISLSEYNRFKDKKMKIMSFITYRYEISSTIRDIA